jgi:hypothetical protein
LVLAVKLQLGLIHRALRATGYRRPALEPSCHTLLVGLILRAASLGCRPRQIAKGQNNKLPLNEVGN